MQYEEFPDITKEQAELLLSKSLKSSTIIKVIVSSIKYIDDFNWLENLCIKYIDNQDYWVKKNAINGLGDIVRVYGKLNKIDLIYKLLEREIAKNPTLNGDIINLKEDIALFNKPTIPNSQ